jgi:predicted AAA+ superfamily ATPase
MFARISKYDRSLVKEQKSLDKYYCIDNGMRGAVLMPQSNDNGKNLENTVFMQLLYGLCCRLFGGIEESQEPDQHHVVFVFDGKTVFLVGITSLSYGQNPHALKIHLAACLDGFFLEFGSHGANFSVIFGISTDFQLLW